MIWGLVALAMATAPAPERLNCAWPNDGKVSVIVFDVSASTIEAVGEESQDLSFPNTWRLVENNKESLVATSSVSASDENAPLRLFVTTMILNRRSGEVAVTEMAFWEGKPRPPAATNGSCRSLPR